jgi:beta-galactosidase
MYVIKKKLLMSLKSVFPGLTPPKWVAMIITFFTVFSGCKMPESGETGNPLHDDLRQRISINDNWKFFKYGSADDADKLIYDIRPELKKRVDYTVADSKPTEAAKVEKTQEVLQPWIMPTGNAFIADSSKHYTRPEGNPGNDFPFVQAGFDDSSWEDVNLPHDWAIKGPFQEGWDTEIGGGMGRLPVNGIAWYRKKINIPEADSAKCIFLDIDGAMSYAMVWLNGQLIGGWPYGYNSWRLDLTPYITVGGENQLAIRIDNPPNSSRWYPGAGIYRNVWLTKTNPVHVGQWGTFVTSTVNGSLARVNIDITISNNSGKETNVSTETGIYELDESGNIKRELVANIETSSVQVESGRKVTVNGEAVIENPRLWGPPPTQEPHMYIAITRIFEAGRPVDRYETSFGIRSLEFNPDSGIFVNGELVKIKGVNNHHDLGALGAAFNTRAAERQLEILKEMGCNAIRMAHNPPAPELLELTDKMGFLVMDEVFDCWERKKTPLDFHLIFPDWHEQDLRSMLRRDRNHPSIIMWSYGNEVGEQYTGEEGAEIGRKLHNIIKEEDTTRPTTSAMNWAKSYMPFPEVMDVISFNYQGEGIRQDPIFENVTDRIKTKPQYEPFHEQFPEKVILSSETASALSSRGIYFYPVTEKISSPVRDGMGGSSELLQVSSYELYAVDFGSSADKVFASLDKHPYSAGEFVWTGFDYLGEPTPYYECRSSYNGIIDLAGFPKDRYYLYQSRWRPDLPMAHILPHWNWPDRVGKITPVHVFTSGDEAELFLNGESLGRKKKGPYQYRLRWDNVVYQPGELKVIAYRNGEKWAETAEKTSGKPVALNAIADRDEIAADGKDIAFVTVKVYDAEGNFIRNATSRIQFKVEGPGELVATDNGDPSDMVEFPSPVRDAFSGKALAIVKAVPGEAGKITLTAESEGLETARVVVRAK